MIVPECLERIVLVPRNGLGNRLQAWASSAILAAQLDVPLKVMWEPEAAAPALPEDLFDSQELRRHFIPRTEVDALVGGRHEDLPRYLWVDETRRMIVLAGHDRGEQAFMDDLVSLLDHPCQPTTVLIIAGGLFHLPSDENFVRQREIFYRGIHWNPLLESAVRSQAARHGPYAALHIRQTDRSIEAPTKRSIRQALATLQSTSSSRSLFIAADNAQARTYWSEQASALEFEPWVADATDFDRTRSSGALSAAVDWLLLASATMVAYPAASSFSAEAAVASGHFAQSIPMIATDGRQRMRERMAVVRSAITYPSRHWRRH